MLIAFPNQIGVHCNSPFNLYNIYMLTILYLPLFCCEFLFKINFLLKGAVAAGAATAPPGLKILIV